MNIFIDTSILFSDPFWKEIFSSQLIDIVRDKRINIYLSEVVLRELRHNFEKNLDKDLFDLRKLNNSLKKNLRRFRTIELPQKEKCLQDFDSYYEEFVKYSNVKILKCEDKYLQPILDRAIKREKPFTETKTELKDALIWLTYSEFANNNDLKDCFLLTANCTDFCDPELLKQKKFELHSDLKKDCDKFKIFTNIKEIYKSNSDYLDKPKVEFKQWIESENIDNSYVFNLLWEYEGDSISSEIQSHIENIEFHDLFEDSHLIQLGGYIDTGNIEWNECKDIEIEIVSDYAIISGVVVVYAEIQGFGYNSVRDPGDEKYPFVGEKSIELDMIFNFTINKEGKPENFEITDIETIR
jgi:predicted nucleic acid-binding protein